MLRDLASDERRVDLGSAQIRKRPRPCSAMVFKTVANDTSAGSIRPIARMT